MRRFLVLGLLCAVLSPSCGDGSAPSGFVSEDAGADAPPNIWVDAGSDSAEDPTLGGPCLDDGQCADGIDCTSDVCDTTVGRCRFQPQHTLCKDDIYCDGEEICELGVGCREGEPIACSDADSCTIDSCIEDTQTCTHVARDADRDGDAVWNCEGGGDCDDTNPRISSQAIERCNNELDDDCDSEVDEADCTSPAHDTCIDPLLIQGTGTYAVDLTAAALDYPTECSEDSSTFRDIVVAIQVEEGKEQDVDLIVKGGSAQVALATAAVCGDATSTRCSESLAVPGQGNVARLRLRNLAAGNHAAYIAVSQDTSVELRVEYLPVSPVPQNETCTNAEVLAPGEHRTVSLVDTERDLSGACSYASGELVYSFELTEPKDVHVYAVSKDGLGTPSLSLRNAHCSDPADELQCSAGSPAHLFARALPTGKYFVPVAASSPTDIDLLLELKPPTLPSPEEGCDAPPNLVPGEQKQITLSERTDAVNLACLGGARDASFALELDTKSDVLALLRLSSGDTGAVSLARAPCKGEKDKIACASSSQSPLRSVAYGVQPGSYRVVAESTRASPVSLTTFVRRAVAPVLVAFADTCDQATLIPETGGRFQGSTVNADADYTAGCDVGGQLEGGARDQMLKLVLTARRRVVFDMKGSSYSTLLLVRSGPNCPGTELSLACAAGYVDARSFLDLVLEPGEYFVQIDGYNGAEGAWLLDVFTGAAPEPQSG